jgi:hypothetical protein
MNLWDGGRDAGIQLSKHELKNLIPVRAFMKKAKVCKYFDSMIEE